LLPVDPPVSDRNTRKMSCRPDIEIGTVWLIQTAVPPVDVRFAVVRSGPVIESCRTSIAASGAPAVRPACASATRNVSESIWCRLNGPFNRIQSLLLRLPRCVPPPSSVLVPMFVPDRLVAASTCCRRRRIWCCAVVVSDGTPPGPPLSVYDTLTTPNTLPPCETSSASVWSEPLQPVLLSSAWPCVSCPSTNVTCTSSQSTTPSSGSVTVTTNGIVSPNENSPPSIGRFTITVGEVLPTVMIVLTEAWSPDESNTVSRTV
jgi:hypothetical protein